MIARRHTPVHFMPYWDQKYPDANQVETRSVEEMIQGVRERLIEAIRLRLRSDVPLGVYLSGGIDSSCLAGIATHILREKDPNARVTAFTLSFPNAESRYDEGPIAQRTAEFIGADMRVLKPTEEDIINAFEVSLGCSLLAPWLIKTRAGLHLAFRVGIVRSRRSSQAFAVETGAEGRLPSRPDRRGSR